jgi:hypothetical protein
MELARDPGTGRIVCAADASRDIKSGRRLLWSKGRGFTCPHQDRARRWTVVATTGAANGAGQRAPARKPAVKQPMTWCRRGRALIALRPASHNNEGAA